MRVSIVDYGSGNLRSAEKSFQRAADDIGGIEIDVTSDAERVASADRIVLPGVGAFGDCQQGLRAVDGMWDAVTEAVIDQGKPFFGICVGMQLMASRGLEHGTHDGFGWVPGDVDRITPDDPALKIPHMGWNSLRLPENPHPVLTGLGDDAHVYFVHSYAFQAPAAEHVLADIDYGGPVIAAVGRDNMFGTQFHPEKSQATGLKLIGNFLGWTP